MGKKISSAIVILLLVLLIICPLLSIFREAAFTEGRFNLSGAIATIAESENAEMIAASLLLGILVVIVSSLIALPLAYIFSRTEFAKYRFFDIIFMIPFMTPPYIASMGWILFMQKRGLMQQLFPSLAFISDWFFSLGGLVLVMSFHVFPFMMTMMKNAMLSVPSSLDEAGAVLGARFLLRIRKLFMPLLTGNLCYRCASCIREDNLGIWNTINSWTAYRIRGVHYRYPSLCDCCSYRVR